MMHRYAWHYCGVPALVRSVALSLVTLGIMAGGPGLRHASASVGCDLLNSQPTQIGFQFELISAFDSGDTVSVTATDPQTGTPNSVVIFVDNALANVASFPGTATFVLPTGGVAVAVKGGVDAGTASLDFNCTAMPPTATPTSTQTMTPTATPTNTPIPNGGSCTINGPACASGNCVDTVCCDTPCTGPLQVCNLAGNLGTCSSIAAPAPATSSTALVVAVLLLAAIGAVAFTRRVRNGRS